ncbi:GGDEF domain-containing protein [Devosia nitrariae]|uniref:GGDEF domain-containing protein n=1 Tax=Devosia nitrariae TaxID=2071872 RepID=UPI0024E0DEF0|nr:GGDEF domain-containing protein [Devosia nitrariae]
MILALASCGAMFWIVGYLALGGVPPAYLSEVVFVLPIVGVLAALLFLFVRNRRCGSAGLRFLHLRNAPEPTHSEDNLDLATGVLNARAFMATVGDELGKGPGALLLIDATQFSVRRPHNRIASRDEPLRLIAGTIRTSVRADDLVGRLATNRFAVYLKGANDADSEQIAQRICESVENTIYLSDQRTIGALSVSIGGTMTRPGMIEPYLRTARAMLDKAKQAGRGRFMLAHAA